MKITAIVCSYNGEKYLNKTLNSFVKQTIPNLDFELILVDNNSSDHTKNIGSEFKKIHPEINFEYYLETKKGLSAARNCGIKNARSPVIVFIDDDAMANDQFLEGHLKIFEKYDNVAACGGKILPVYPNDKAPDWLSKYIWGIFSLVDLGETEKPFDHKFPAGCNMAFRKEILESIGNFNEEITYRSDDKHVFLELKKINALVYYAPLSIAHHIIDENRQSDQTFKKVSYLTGAGERERFNGNIFKQLLVLLEYLFKLAAGIILGLGFILQGQFSKAKYIIWNRLLVFYGFFFYKG